MENKGIVTNEGIDERSKQSELLLNENKDKSDGTYMDLYLSVTESPYKVNKFLVARKKSNETTITAAGETQITNTTFDCLDNEATLFLPFKQGQYSGEVDPLSMTTACAYESPSKVQDFVNHGQFSLSQPSEIVGNNTIFIPSTTPNLSKEIDLLINKAGCSNESPSTNNIGEEHSALDVNQIGDTSDAETLHLSLNESEMSSTDYDHNGFTENDSSGIGSLLMLSTELNDSTTSKDLFSSTVSCNDISGIVSNLDLDDKLQSNSKVSIGAKRLINFDSSVNEGASIAFRPINHSLSQSEVNDGGSNNVSLSEHGKLLPSMKSQLKQLMLYIKVVSNANVRLEEKVQTFKEDIEKIKEENSKLANDHIQINEEKKLLRDELENKNIENELIKEELLNLKKTFAPNNDEVDITKELDSANEKILELSEKLNKKNSLEEEICRIIVDINKHNVENSKQCFDNCVFRDNTSISKLLSQDITENVRCGNIIARLNEELDLLKTQSKSSIIYQEEYINKLKMLEDKNVFLNNQLEKLQENFESEVGSLRSHINELREEKAKISVECDRIDQEKSLLEINSHKINDENVTLKEQLDCVHNKLQSVMDEVEFLKEKVNSSQEQVALLRDQLEKSELLFESEKMEYQMQIGQYDVKYKLVNSQVESLKESLQNSESKLKLLLEGKEQIQEFESENLKLKGEMLENINLFSKFLNLKPDCTYDDIYKECQKRLYMLTVLEEKLKGEELNNEVIKSENRDLREKVESASIQIKKLENELGQSRILLREEKETTVKLNVKYSELDTCYQDHLMSASQIQSDFQEFKILFNNFFTALQHYFMSPSGSFSDFLDSVCIIFEKLIVKSVSSDILSQKKEILDYINLFCNELHKILSNCYELSKNVSKSIEDINEHLEIDISGTLGKLDEFIQQCLSLKMKRENVLESLCQSEPDIQTNAFFNEYFNIAFELINNTLVLSKNYLKVLTMRDENKTKNSSSGSLSDLQLSLKQDKVFQADVPPSCKFCKDKEEKLKEAMVSLLNKNCQLSSQQLEMSNLKSRYYEKYNTLEKARDKISTLKKKLVELEKENENLKKTLEVENVVTVTMEAAVQCEEVKVLPPPPPPPNFVQVCKIKELNRKLEKLMKKYSLLKEETMKKDEQIYSLSETLNKFSHSNTVNDNRSVLVDRTNSNLV